MTEPPPPPDPEIAQLIEALAAGELSPPEAARVRALLAGDPRAAALAPSIERTEAALRAQEPTPVPLGLVASVLARIEESPASMTSVRAPPFGLAAAIAAAALLVFGAWRAVDPAGPGALPLPSPLRSEVVAETVDRLVGDAVPDATAWASLAAGGPIGDVVPGSGPVGLLSVAAGVGLVLLRGRAGSGAASVRKGPPCAS